MKSVSRHRCIVLSDTHGSLDARILALCENADSIVHAGDIGEYSIVSSLQKYCDHVFVVRGNNDIPSKWPEQEHKKLEAIPLHLEFELQGYRISVDHGHRYNPVVARHDKLRRRYADADVVIYGHSHRLIVDKVGNPWVINPGAAGKARTYGGPSCLELICTNNTLMIHQHIFDLPAIN